MSGWQYSDQSQESIYRFFPDGAMESLASDSEFGKGIIANGLVSDPPPVGAAQIQSALDAVLNTYLDSVAGQRRYDNRFTCALRAGFPGPFQAEGLAFAAFMDECNMRAYMIMREVKAGIRAVPTAEELIADMPVIEWPPSPIPDGAL